MPATKRDRDRSASRRRSGRRPRRRHRPSRHQTRKHHGHPRWPRQILDFGLAKQVAAAASAATGRHALPTATPPEPSSAPPPTCLPNRSAATPWTPASDIFSFGRCSTNASTAQAVRLNAPTGRSHDRHPPRGSARTSRNRLRPLCAKSFVHCLEKEPEHRFHSARDLGFALRTAHTSTRTSGAVALISQSGPIPLPEPVARKRNWIWPALTSVLAGLCAILLISRFTTPPGVDLTQYRLSPFATDAEVESEGAWSPDGKSIAYLKTIDGIPQLMVREVQSPTPVQLTESEFPVRQTFWAPDASLLYFVLQAGRGELWGISPAGGQPSRILDGVITANISPDGKTLALWRVNAQNGKIRGSVWLSSPPGAAPTQYRPAPFETPEIDINNRVALLARRPAIFLIEGNGASPAGSSLPRRHGRSAHLFAAPILAQSHRQLASRLPPHRPRLRPRLQRRADLWLADSNESISQLTSAPCPRSALAFARRRRLVFSESRTISTSSNCRSPAAPRRRSSPVPATNLALLVA